MGKRTEYPMIWQKVNTYVTKYHMIAEGDSIIIGLSGGGDSVCLLRYLMSVQKEKSLQIYAVHVNHMLRGEEAQRDQQFVEDFCRKWAIPLWVVKKDVEAESRMRHCSTEEAGRMVRYACFEEAADRWHCNRIAVAHHKNDVVETMLFRMARGTGVRGLAGIPPVSGRIIRPLLCLEKEEICDILEKLEQDYVEDSTNYETEYSRNQIRLHILPELTTMNPRAVNHIGQIAEQVMELNDYLAPVFDHLYQKYVRFSVPCQKKAIGTECKKDAEENGGNDRERECRISVEALSLMHPVESQEIVSRMLIDMAGSQKDISAVHVKQMLHLAAGKEGKYQELPYGLVAEKTEGDLRLLPRRIFFKNRAALTTSSSEHEVLIDLEMVEKHGCWSAEFEGSLFDFCLEEYVGGDIEKNDCVKYFNCDRICNALSLRKRRSGDYFILDKEGRHKSLQRYFIDEKIPSAKRNEMIVLAEGSHVLWVVGGRISEAYKVCPDTRRMLVVRRKK